MITYPRWHDSYPEQKQESQNDEHLPQKHQKLLKLGPPWVQYKQSYNLAFAEALKFKSEQSFGPMFTLSFTDDLDHIDNLQLSKPNFMMILDGESPNPFIAASEYADICLDTASSQDPSCISVVAELITETKNVKPYYSILYNHAEFSPPKKVSALCKDLGLQPVDASMIEALQVTPGPVTSSIKLLKSLPF